MTEETTMKQRIIADRQDSGQGPRVREFARIARESAERSTDPRVRAMTRAHAAAVKPFARYAALGRRLGA